LVYAAKGDKWRAEVPGHSKRRGRNQKEGAESLMQKRRADTYAKEEGQGYMEEA
jgi:hypothetical protein